MKFSKLKLVFVLTMALTSAVVSAQTVKLALTGMQEVPAVTTAASGSGTITIAPDMSVSGSLATVGVEETMAHNRMAAAGQNGPVIVPMMKTGDNVWSIAAGAKPAEVQY